MTTEQEITDKYAAYDDGYKDGYDGAPFRPERWVEDGTDGMYRTAYNDGRAARERHRITGAGE